MPRSTALSRSTGSGGLRLLRVNGVELDLDGYQVRADNRPSCLPLKEYQLLRALMENAGQVQGHRQLLDRVWGPDHPDDNATLRIHIMRLRKKIETDHRRPSRLRTVPGHGYLFDIGTKVS